MAVAMPLPNRISQDSKPGVIYNTLKSELGDNVRQYTENGLNSERATWTIVYNYLTKAELNTVLAALKLVKHGKDQLSWQSFFDTSTKLWTVTADGYTITIISSDVFNISFNMEEEH